MSEVLQKKAVRFFVLFVGLALTGLVVFQAPVWAKKEKENKKSEVATSAKANPVPDKKISAEEQEIIANLALLEKLDFLVDSDPAIWLSLGQTQAGDKDAK